MLVPNAVGSMIGKAAREFFEHVENATAQISFEFSLGQKGLLLDVIQRASPVRVPHERARREEREEEGELFAGAERGAIGERELEISIG